jgi:hypothetical protein
MKDSKATSLGPWICLAIAGLVVVTLFAHQLGLWP